MHRYGYWGGDAAGVWMIFHSAFWVLLLAALVAGGILLLRSGRSGRTGEEGLTAVELLDRRYANGEIDREEYLQRKKDILETPPRPAPPQE